jgi:hypothetical protein
MSLPPVIVEQLPEVAAGAAVTGVDGVAGHQTFVASPALEGARVVVAADAEFCAVPPTPGAAGDFYDLDSHAALPT